MTTANGERVVVFTDGGCNLRRHGIGAWAYRIISGQPPSEAYGGFVHTTNNRMELMAVIMALSATEPGAFVWVVTDSKYVIRGCTEWLRWWKRSGWRTAQGDPVKSKDLWERLDGLLHTRSVEFQHVMGHSGVAHNEHVDALCTAEMQRLYQHYDQGGLIKTDTAA